MKEVFEHAYEGMENALSSLVGNLIAIVQVCCIAVIYITVPIWFIPYSLCFRKKSGGNKDEK